jgi:hypothetical protein
VADCVRVTAGQEVNEPMQHSAVTFVGRFVSEPTVDHALSQPESLGFSIDSDDKAVTHATRKQDRSQLMRRGCVLMLS